MVELRPHPAEASFVRTIREMEGEGYRLAFLSVSGRPACVASYRFETRLWCDRLLHVDDRVTAGEARSRGYGGAMLDWLEVAAKEEGCSELHLDSGAWRTDAHRFYRNHGLEDSSLHFRIEV